MASAIQGVEHAEGPAIDLQDDPRPLVDLDYKTWFKFAARTYHISEELERDYIVVNTPICPSGLPNRNGIGFPLAELVSFQPAPVCRQSYKAWTGTPVHFNHDNGDYTKAHGVVLDTVLRPVTGYGGKKIYKVMGLAAIDKTKYKEVAAKVMSGEYNTYSMGAMADYFTCSVCGEVAYKKDKSHRNCQHITHADDVNFRLVRHMGQSKLAYLNAHGISPIELSIVPDPAWVPALSDVILHRGLE